MKFNVNCELGYTLNDPATFLFSLKCLEAGGQKILSEKLTTNPPVPVEEFRIDSGMNRFFRLRTYNPGAIFILYEAQVDVSHRFVDASAMVPAVIAELAPEAIPYIFPSRYCQSDSLRGQADSIFGHIDTPYEMAMSISDWIFENVSYVIGSSGETCSAVDTFEKREGVCRDFAHLGIALCRAMNLPARYASFYAHDLKPQDFHACFEVFIGGQWYVIDPTRLAPLNGLVRIATGRDAADAAVCTYFGDPGLIRSVVSCAVEEAGFEAVTRDSLVNAGQAIAIL